MTTTDLSPLVFHPGDRAAQSKIRLPLPIVLGNRDYKEREELLRRMDEVLVLSGVEREFIDKEIADAIAASERHNQPLTDRRRTSVQQFAKGALRCTLARILANESHRPIKPSCQEPGNAMVNPQRDPAGLTSQSLCSFWAGSDLGGEREPHDGSSLRGLAAASRSWG